MFFAFDGEEILYVSVLFQRKPLSLHPDMHQILFDDIAKVPEGQQERNIFLPELVLALDPDQMRKKVVKPHQPFRTV